MYIPSLNSMSDHTEILAFMQRFSFGTIITAQENFPTATHLPFLVSMQNEQMILTSHFAKANEQWKSLENSKVLVIFSEPHAYISPQHYEKELNVPTWNYMAVHAYGQGRLVVDEVQVRKVLEATIDNYEAAYRVQWNGLPEEYKVAMSKGIVAFEIVVTDLQGKKKLSQNKTALEQERIIAALSVSENSSEKLIAEYMKKTP